MSFSRKLAATAALSLSLVGIMGGAHAASAQPAGPQGSATKGCPVEDANGHVTYVPVGTVVFPFHCAPNGDWHWGWLTTDKVAPTPTGPQVPHAATAAKNTTRSAR